MYNVINDIDVRNCIKANKDSFSPKLWLVPMRLEKYLPTLTDYYRGDTEVTFIDLNYSL